ncbi:MAG: hypothetical protein HYS53_01200 [Candidatus Aenigmarchaeota archaeon]|nr:hypothetical protein [Candidatus Aenigmarchaeota archaeon]
MPDANLQRTKVYIDVSLQQEVEYNGAKANVITASLTVPGEPELASHATMVPFAWESLGNYHTFHTDGDKPQYAFEIRTERGSAVSTAEIIEPAGQAVLTYHLDEIISAMERRRHRAVGGIASKEGKISHEQGWQSLYDVEVRVRETQLFLNLKLYT